MLWARLVGSWEHDRGLTKYCLVCMFARLVQLSRNQRIPLYLGGMMGPFGGTVLIPMIPELRTTFETTTATMGWGLGAYFFPYALFLLVSGTIGERCGRSKCVQTAFFTYSLAALVCFASPNLGWFFAGRTMQGTANAFMTPLLLASLVDATEPERLGRSMGSYAAFQALGGVLGLLVGGISADGNWRWAFIAISIMSAILLVFLLQRPVEESVNTNLVSIRKLLSGRMLALGLMALATSAGPAGVGVLVAIVARDNIGLSGSAAGLVLVSGTLTAAAFGPIWGRFIDLIGARRAGVVGVILSSLSAVLLIWVSTASGLVVVWMLGGAAAGFIATSFQSLAAVAVTGNRGGGISFVLSHRFLGSAIGPLIWLPVYSNSPMSAFLGCASLGAIALVAVIASGYDTLPS